MATVFIALGSNLGNCQANLQIAHHHLNEIGVIRRQSTMIWTQPQYVTDQPQFLNQVVSFETDLSPLDLLRALKAIEQKMGRETTYRYGPRLIDLDILTYEEVVMDTPELTLPHPEMHKRDFVMIPLQEIAPEFVEKS